MQVIDHKIKKLKHKNTSESMPSDKIAAAANEGKGKKEPKTSKTQKTPNAVAYEESKEAVPIAATGKYQIISILISECLAYFCL